MRDDLTQRTARLIGQDKVDLLARKTVMIFGMGGVGSYVTEALGRAGGADRRPANQNQGLAQGTNGETGGGQEISPPVHDADALRSVLRRQGCACRRIERTAIASRHHQ